MEITRDELDTIKNQLELEDSNVRESYSGRGMYGRSCLGFVIDRYSEVNEVILGIVLRDVLEDAAWEIARDMRTDSMGMGTIIYFPGTTVESDDDDDDDDDE